MKLTARYPAIAVSLLLTIGQLGCGGGGGGGAQNPGIGSAGGAVSSASGAQVVVPAGALSGTVQIGVAEDDAGAPALPAGAQVFGAMHAFTPHGTTFAIPATVSVPFDPAQVPAGATVQLLKTTGGAARTGWQVVAGASVSGGLISGQVSEFSNLFAGSLPCYFENENNLPPCIVTEPANVQVDAGQTATFLVLTRNFAPDAVSYQWMRSDTGAIPGATGPTYTLPSASSGDDGVAFSVMVTDSLGSVTSRQALLTVSSNPTGGWVTLGAPVATGSNLPGGMATSSTGRVAISYLVGGTAQGARLRVKEWDGNTWTQLGGDLDLSNSNRKSLTPGSVVYDGQNQLVVAWGRQDFDTNDFGIPVRRWSGTQWEMVGPDKAFEWTTLNPQLLIDPQTGRLIASTISSSGSGWVREWNGTTWQAALTDPADVGAGASFGVTQASGLIALNNGQRRLVVRAGDQNTGPNEFLAQLRGPDGSNNFSANVGPIIPPSPVPSGSAVSLATDGVDPYALLGDPANGPVLVHKLVGGTWQAFGGDTGARGTLRTLLVPASGLPFVAWLGGQVAPRNVAAVRWDGTAWAPMPSPNPASVNVLSFLATLLPNGTPLAAISSAQELVVRQLQ
jgi:hypothetical protein